MKETKQPIYITVNGRGDSVLLDIEAYERLEMYYKIISAYNRGMDDVKNGRVGKYDEMMERLDKEFGFKR